MKSILKFAACVLFIGIFIHLSCKKEISCEGCGDGNKSPIANAGPDQVITLPTDSVSLDGSGSSDPDERISSYLWTKISGPSSFNIIKPSDSATKVKTLVTGTYLFELKVTDNGGLSAKDTMRVIVDSVVRTNHPPIANAGADQTITLPINTANLDGSGSTDPDNNIISYTWTKVSGPSSFNIVNAATMQPQASALVQGTYQFELKVTDGGALFSKDIVQVTVNPESPPPPSSCTPNRPLIYAQLVPFGTLSQVRTNMTVASAGDKVLFAGGVTGYPYTQSTRVDIYDFTTQSWSTAELSQARWGMTAAVLGNRIFFAGGGFPGGIGVRSSRVDIYDVSINSWSTAELSEPRSGIVAAAVGDKVFFAGGGNEETGTVTNKVDTYDQSTNTWSIATLSVARFGLAATTAGDKIYFAGGLTNNGGLAVNTIDVYDNTTGSWSVSTLNVPKAFMASIFKNGKIYWAGGVVYYDPASGSSETCQVEIKDINTQTSSFDNLFQKNCYFSAFEKDNKILYLPDLESSNGILPAKFDVYDLTSDTWSIGQLNQNIFGKAIISVNNTIYVAGGTVNGVLSNQVWKLEF